MMADARGAGHRPSPASASSPAWPAARHQRRRTACTSPSRSSSPADPSLVGQVDRTVRGAATLGAGARPAPRCLGAVATRAGELDDPARMSGRDHRPRLPRRQPPASLGPAVIGPARATFSSEPVERPRRGPAREPVEALGRGAPAAAGAAGVAGRRNGPSRILGGSRWDEASAAGRATVSPSASPLPVADRLSAAGRLFDPLEHPELSRATSGCQPNSRQIAAPGSKAADLRELLLGGRLGDVASQGYVPPRSPRPRSGPWLSCTCHPSRRASSAAVCQPAPWPSTAATPARVRARARAALRRRRCAGLARRGRGGARRLSGLSRGRRRPSRARSTSARSSIWLRETPPADAIPCQRLRRLSPPGCNRFYRGAPTSDGHLGPGSGHHGPAARRRRWRCSDYTLAGAWWP